MRIPTRWVILTAFFMAAALFAGDRANFSGEWVFNETKSTLDEMGAQFLPGEVVIMQTGDDITIRKIVRREYEDDLVIEETLTLDGLECKSEFWGSSRMTTATYSEDGGRLTVSSTIRFEQGGEMSITEIFSLEDSGKTITIKHHSSSDWGERDVTLVFNKKEKPE